MPIETFPVSADGLLVDVVVGLSGTDLSKLIAAGQPVPAPVRVTGIIDTGTDVTSIASPMLKQLKLSPIRQVKSHTAAGLLATRLYQVSLSLLPHGNGHGHTLVQPQLIVMEMSTIGGKIDVLIGLDILLNCKLLLDGPARQFHLEF
jgi:hypothetical protein